VTPTIFFQPARQTKTTSRRRRSGSRDWPQDVYSLAVHYTGWRVPLSRFNAEACFVS